MPRGGSRPGAGRKPSADPTRATTLGVRVTPEELATLEAAAAPVKVATWLRETGLRVARRTRKVAPTPAVELLPGEKIVDWGATPPALHEIQREEDRRRRKGKR